MPAARAQVRTEPTKERVHLRPSRVVLGYLQELADQGILGNKRATVAEALVVDGIRRLIQEGLLQMKPTAAKAQLRTDRGIASTKKGGAA